MSILVCGGAGYIGSHTNKQLYQEGYSTVVVDNLVYGHSDAVKWGKFYQCDLEDIETLRGVFQQQIEQNDSITAVLHFAAYAYVGESVTDPEKYYRNNVANTLNLLKVMREYNCNQLVFSSTCATYGIPHSVPITEDAPQNPINPYGASKLMVERILQDYCKAYGLRFVVLRYFNAAGADKEGELGESHNPETHLIPLVLDAALGVRDDVCIYGTDYETADGSCVRDYIHVMDLATAHVLALRYLEKDGESDFFNLGNERGTSVIEVIEAARRITGKEFKVTIAPRRDGDPAMLIGSRRKAQEVLHWQPVYDDIEAIIGHAWQWHKRRAF